MKKKTEIIQTTVMPNLAYVGTSRYICDVLEDMRKCIKHLNIDRIPGLIEEAQAKANRMEEALGHESNIDRLEEDINKLKDARRALKKEVKALIKTRGKK